MMPAAMPLWARVGDWDIEADEAPSPASPAQAFGEAEVQNLDLAVRRDLDVSGLQVPVDDA